MIQIRMNKIRQESPQPFSVLQNKKLIGFIFYILFLFYQNLFIFLVFCNAYLLLWISKWLKLNYKKKFLFIFLLNLICYRLKKLLHTLCHRKNITVNVNYKMWNLWNFNTKSYGTARKGNILFFLPFFSFFYNFRKRRKHIIISCIFLIGPPISTEIIIWQLESEMELFQDRLHETWHWEESSFTFFLLEKKKNLRITLILFLIKKTALTLLCLKRSRTTWKLQS